ncbi:MAG TPA: hypothetical protein VFG20_09015, partial [Planctomycetaceae bacterium]|nr:hypothetical protein [Planctomycetaceae bacterium]
MGRIIGLIGGTCLLIAAWRLTGQQHNDHTLKAGVETRQAQAQLSPRDAYRKGKELYLRGKYDEAQALLKQALKANSGLTAADRQQTTEYLSRTELKLAQQAVGERGARGQSPDADPFATEGDAPVKDATRTRIERLLAQAQDAVKRGDKQEAFKLAQQANQIAKAAGMTFGRQELSPSQFLASLQGVPATRATKTPSLPEWANEDAPVRTANAVDTEMKSGVELTGNLEEEFAPPAAEKRAAATGGSKNQAQTLLNAARADIKAGRLEEARQKALDAQQMRAAYDLFEDRPELVLSDLERRARTMTIAANDAPKAAAKAENAA